MGVMQTVGAARLPAHANVEEDAEEYVVRLDVSDFTEQELTVELSGRTIAVHGEQEETAEDRGATLRLHETLHESFRLPDDADLDRIGVTFAHGELELRVPRLQVEPRRLEIGRPPQAGGAGATPS